MAVEYKMATSIWKKTRVGFSQGDVSSANLFNIYISDLAETVKKINNIQICMYAEIKVIWTTANTKN